MYREALRSWRDLGLVWDEARTGIDMAILLDPADPEVRDAAANAHAILQRLGARPYLERLDAALARGSAAPAGASAPAMASRPTQELGAAIG
jgi:hypothetical protein